MAWQNPKPSQFRRETGSVCCSWLYYMVKYGSVIELRYVNAVCLSYRPQLRDYEPLLTTKFRTSYQ